jgi:hypothetical protein
MDPDVRDERVGRLCPCVGTHADAVWSHLIQIDPREMLDLRLRQTAFLARYGHQSVLQWADVEAVELGEHYRALADIVRAERGDP